MIVNADDFGLSHDVNIAIEQCFKRHFINQATIMVNMPYFEDAVRRAELNGFKADVGLHLNLVEGHPLTNSIKQTSLCDSSGIFNGSIMYNHLNRFYLSATIQDAVSEEIEAQIAKYKSYGFTLNHIDSHQHAHTNASIYRLLLPIFRQGEMQSIRLSRNIPEFTISVWKRLYKTMLNKRFCSLNQGSVRYHSIRYFGSQQDVSSSFGTHIPESVEMMIHPIMINNQLFDAVSGVFLENVLVQLV